MASRAAWVKRLLCVLGLSLALVSLGWMFWIGRDVPYAEQQKLYEMLRNVAGIMFAVFGLWIGLLYPELRKKVFSRGSENSDVPPKGIEAEREDRQADHLLQPFFISLTIVLVTVVVDIAGPIVRRIDWLVQHKNLLRGVSYILIGILALAQIVSILQAMKLTDGLKATISRGRSLKDIKNRIRQNRKE